MSSLDIYKYLIRISVVIFNMEHLVNSDGSEESDGLVPDYIIKKKNICGYGS